MYIKLKAGQKCAYGDCTVMGGSRFVFIVKTHAFTAFLPDYCFCL